jgi:glycine oxidase
MRILVRGAGVAGLTLAHELARRGIAVTVFDKRRQIAGNASWFAGGMLAPWCESESAPAKVLSLGTSAADCWEKALPGSVSRKGTLVIAPARDTSELDRFSDRTSGHERVAENTIAELEPDIEGRFRSGLFFRKEAHIDPRLVLESLAANLASMGAEMLFGEESPPTGIYDFECDCTGIAAKRPGLRAVRGEMVILRTPEISLSRPVRLLHPRIPVYVVPRANHQFMVGATMIESDFDGRITARSLMELLNAAYALHPAFGEAEIMETGTGMRPAYADNLPRVERNGKNLSINGFYRHGFLLAPAMAMIAADMILGPNNPLELADATQN